MVDSTCDLTHVLMIEIVYMFLVYEFPHCRCWLMFVGFSHFVSILREGEICGLDKIEKHKLKHMAYLVKHINA